MRYLIHHGKILLLPILACFVTACSSNQPAPPVEINKPENITLLLSKTFDDIKLNVSLMLFDPGLTEDESDSGPFAQLRHAEAHYLPHVLKDTLDASGHWGGVRLLPEIDPTAELQITGTILESNGVELKLHLRASDTTGRVWLDKIYTDFAIDHAYAMQLNYLDDPFQDGFNLIANDLATAREQLTPVELGQVLDTSLLRYGIALSPESFSEYLVTNDAGLVEISRLPHREDPMFNRVKSIRESEYAFTDTVGEHYDALFHRMGETYTYWRRYSYELIMGNRSLAGSDARSGAKSGTFRAMEKVYKAYREWRMNEDALREITASFDDEITPTVIEIEDRVINLSGSLHSQYAAWRKLLREIYTTETGLPTATPVL
jgi:hypothetical protein